jgi:hypothetical protein
MGVRSFYIKEAKVGAILAQVLEAMRADYYYRF